MPLEIEKVYYELMLRITMSFSETGEHDSAQIRSILENTAADYGWLILGDVWVTEVKKAGRPRNSSSMEKVEILLKRQVKPFTTASFAKFIGVQRSTAWKHLERLVKQGAISKMTDENGINRYQVIRPDKS